MTGIITVLGNCPPTPPLFLYDLTVFVIYRINVNKFIFAVINYKAMHLTGQNEWPAVILSPGSSCFKVN